MEPNVHCDFLKDLSIYAVAFFTAFLIGTLVDVSVALLAVRLAMVLASWN